VSSPRYFLAIFSLITVGCAGNLYEYNMTHAEIAPAAKLSPAELEQVIRTVTNRSLVPIIAVTRRTERSHDEIIVYAATRPTDAVLTVYHLEKGNDGLWHITHSGDGTVIVL